MTSKSGSKQEGKTYNFPIRGTIERLEKEGVAIRDGRWLIVAYCGHPIMLAKRTGRLKADDTQEAESILKGLRVEMKHFGIRIGFIPSEKQLYHPTQEYIVSIDVNAPIDAFHVENTSPPPWITLDNGPSVQVIAKNDNKTVLKALRMTEEKLSMVSSALEDMHLTNEISKEPSRVSMDVEPLDVDDLAHNCRIRRIPFDYDPCALNPIFKTELKMGGFVQVMGGKTLQFYGPHGMEYAQKYIATPGQGFFYENSKTY